MSDIDHQLAHRLVGFFEKFSSWEHEVVRESGLTLPQMHAIEIIGHMGPLRMKELAHEMGVTTGTLTVLVDRLEKGGQVERVRNDRDRRSYRIHLTEEGKRHFANHDEHHLSLTREMTEGWSAEDRNTLHDLLGRLMERM